MLLIQISIPDASLRRYGLTLRHLRHQQDRLPPGNISLIL